MDSNHVVLELFAVQFDKHRSEALIESPGLTVYCDGRIVSEAGSISYHGR